MNPLLSAANVSFAYTDRPVVREVSVALNPGEIVALLGPNGSGKTTLIRALLGHLRASGSVQWEGRPLSDWPRREFARRVAYLPQSPTIEPQQRVIDILRLGRAPYLRAFGIESQQDVSVVEQVINQLDLSAIVNRPIDELSGGQRQRVFVGRCLIQQPAAMLLDEPSTFLDLKAQVDLARLLKTLAKEQQIGILMASHDLNLAGGLADRVVLLKDGAMVRQGTVDDVLRPDVLGDVYGVTMDRIEAGGRPALIPRM